MHALYQHHDFIQTEICCFESYSVTSGSRFTVHCCLFIQISALQLEIQNVKSTKSQNTNAFFHKLEVKLILWRKRCVQLEDGFGSQGNESFLRKAGCDYHISKSWQKSLIFTQNFTSRGQGFVGRFFPSSLLNSQPKRSMYTKGGRGGAVLTKFIDWTDSIFTASTS